MRVVAALGGNALLRRGEPAEAGVQSAHVQEAAACLAQIAAEHELIVTHGNGPQVGLLALQSEAYESVSPYPLDVLGAESEGMVGYMLEQALRNRLPGRTVATLLTQVLVDPQDPAFDRPSKPIGPTYTREQALRIAAQREVSVAQDGEAWRRVVPSPEPRSIVEVDAVRLLVDAGAIVICAGGGGVPVARDSHGALHGLEAVIDKDLAACLLARELDAQALLLLTDVPFIELNRGTAAARPLWHATPAQLRKLGLPAGSMGPKAEAAARFAEAGGVAVIARLDDASAALAQQTGTVVRPTAPSSQATDASFARIA